jgi:hypothetical protein
MKYFLGFLVCIAVIIGVFILVIRGITGNSAPKNLSPVSDYANTDTVVRMTVDGPIGSDILHRAYRITVGRSQTTIESLQGYDYTLIDSKVYSNSQSGYENFLRALDLAGFRGDTSKSQNNDERGVCATGDRFIFEVMNGSSSTKRYWSTSCRGKGGNYKGNISQSRNLFNAQVPTADLSEMVNGLGV